MTEKLKPCPFCGSQTITLQKIQRGWKAVCEECFSAGEPNFDGGPGDTADRAAAAWNRRTGEGEAWAEIERLTKERDEAIGRAEELEVEGERVATEFEGLLWKEVRSLIDEYDFDWSDRQYEGVPANEAVDHIRQTLVEEERRIERLILERDEASAEIERLHADNEQLRNLLVEVQIMMRHARVFVASREQIKRPEGVELYDGLLKQIDSAVGKGANHE